MNIGLIGYGKMGKAIEAIALERGHTISWKVSQENNLENQDLKNVDAAIEFTNPQSTISHIKYCLTNKLPLVVGTTGWNASLKEIENFCELNNGTLLHASNFSIGVNIFFQINQKIAQLMNAQSEYKASIEEIHHTEKLDSPSGTAISLANAILENNGNYLSWKVGEDDSLQTNDKQLPLIAKRFPNVPGTHTVEYKSEIDSIKITHEAFSRKGFALGAVLAAEWIQNKKGVFTMNDVLGI